MWIMLIKKLPTRPSPARMSIFWSTPWPDDHYAPRQSSQCRVCLEIPRKYKDGFKCGCDGEPDLISPEDQVVLDKSFLGWEHNWTGARKINFAGQEVRVFPDEFSVIKPENLRLYILGDDTGPGSHEFVAGTVAEDVIIQGVLDGETRPIYEMALLDCANPAQAMAVALGMDITLPDSEFPAIGWYRCKREYAERFCEDWELEEHTQTLEEIEA